MSIISYFQSEEAKIIYDPTLANNTPKQIQKAASSGVAADYWSVGDAIPITLNGTVGAYTFDSETWYAFIIGFDHNAEIEGENTIHFQFGKTEDGTDIAFVDGNYNFTGSSAGFRMNTSNTNSGGWESSYMRKTICPAFLSAMPSDWQNVISACTKYTDNVGGASGSVDANVTATEDEIFLLSQYEVLASATDANTYEANYQEQYDYYASGNSKIKNRSDTLAACYWWLRSTYANSGIIFRTVDTGGGSNGIAASSSRGLAPGFMLS